ncbi:hypothetical protein [Aerosakkonema funiforme]|uniref:hypothetical protein n=1 Tax=Aerosakkonema funiforme TaxID=1246630 RepID=UPI0035BB05AF
MSKESQPVSRIPRLEKKYRDETRLWIILLCLVLLVLVFFSFAQFAILDNFFKTTFNIPDRAKVFGIPTNNLLGFIATATLPITVLIDESNILNEKLKLILPVIGKNFSTIWVVFLADLFLTALAFLESNQSRDFNILLNLVTSFMIGASFSTFILYLTKGMSAVGNRASSAWRNLQIVSVYGIDPVPYGDDEKVRLSTEAEIAREEATKLRQLLEESQLIYGRDIQELKDKISVYQNHLGSLGKLKDNFKQIKEMFQELTPKSEVFFEKFTAIEESISNFIIAKLESKEAIERDINTISSRTIIEPDIPKTPKVDNANTDLPVLLQPNAISITNFEFQDVWPNLTLPSEISPIIIGLLNAMERQNFPVPQVGRYTPKNNLASCTVLQFEAYKIIVYCRDENYIRGERWDSSDELKFKCKLMQQNIRGFLTLHLTEQELLTNSGNVLEQIKSAIAMRKSMNFNG